jgi:hypothetical protein
VAIAGSEVLCFASGMGDGDGRWVWREWGAYSVLPPMLLEGIDLDN